MRTKIIYSSLIITATAFGSLFYFSSDEKTIFPFSRAKVLPPLQASTLDYSNVKTTTEKKQVFFDTLRPIVHNQNQKIRDTRQRIEFARDHNIDRQWLADIAQKYKVEWDTENPDWETLLMRVDTIPLELVMTQAANESAWGQSRFAQQANNLFGQWCFSKGCGIVPAQRDKGQKHEVKSFESINHSVSSYMHNINTTRAYKSLRKIRADLRQQGKPLSAIVLATGLEKYSTRGKAYVKELQSMIKTNKHLIHGLELSQKTGKEKTL